MREAPSSVALGIEPLALRIWEFRWEFLPIHYCTLMHLLIYVQRQSCLEEASDLRPLVILRTEAAWKDQHHKMRAMCAKTRNQIPPPHRSDRASSDCLLLLASFSSPLSKRQIGTVEIHQSASLQLQKLALRSAPEVIQTYKWSFLTTAILSHPDTNTLGHQTLSCRASPILFTVKAARKSHQCRLVQRHIHPLTTPALDQVVLHHRRGQRSQINPCLMAH